MSVVRRLVLIAAPQAVSRELGDALREDAEVLGAEHADEAIFLIDRQRPDLVVVCYVFDEMRPFRLISYVREELGRTDIPIVLVRALPVPLGTTQEAEIRESYRSLGVADFVNFRDEAQERGVDAALEHFRAVILSLLPGEPDE